MKEQVKRIALLGLLTVFGLLSADAQIFRGDKYFQKHDYSRALEAYEKAYVDNFANSYLTRKIADSYRKLGEVETSLVWYKRTLEMDQSEQDDMLYYAQALKTIEQYEESQKWYAYYAQLRPEDSRGSYHMRDQEYYLSLKRDSGLYRIQKLEMSTDKPEFGIARYGSKMLFSSAGVENPGLKSKWDWEDPYMDVYEADVTADGELINAKKLNSNVNSKLHDGPVWYDGEHNELYITRNNEKGGKPILDEYGRVNLKIYRSRKVDGRWDKAEELSINSNSFSCAHPTVSADGRQLYFSSNRPGGLGGNDIYVCQRVGDDWSEPVNMGRPVNTEGDEMFPVSSIDGRLFFASDGHAGLGGVDLFYSEIIGGDWAIPTNMGYPINSSSDDFGAVVEADGRSGYFSSNRNPGAVQDDIYRFTMPSMVRVVTSVSDEAILDGFDYGLLRVYNEDGDFVGIFEQREGGDAVLEMDKKAGRYHVRLDSSQWVGGDVTFVITAEDEMDIGEVPISLLSLAALPKVDYRYEMTTQEYETLEALESVDVALYHAETGELLHELQTDKLGQLTFDFDPTIAYRMKMTKEGYGDKSIDIPVRQTAGTYSLNEQFKLLLSKIELGKAIALNDIYYDFDKYNIRNDARPELDRLADLLLENDRLNIAINSHTDSRGKAAYNKWLSQQRAQSVVDYLVSKGVDQSRLVAQGFGEEKPVNDCLDGVKCDVNSHQLNRRTEFVILGGADSLPLAME